MTKTWLDVMRGKMWISQAEAKEEIQSQEGIVSDDKQTRKNVIKIVISRKYLKQQTRWKYW